MMSFEVAFSIRNVVFWNFCTNPLDSVANVVHSQHNSEEKKERGTSRTIIVNFGFHSNFFSIHEKMHAIVLKLSAFVANPQ